MFSKVRPASKNTARAPQCVDAVLRRFLLQNGLTLLPVLVHPQLEVVEYEVNVPARWSNFVSIIVLIQIHESCVQPPAV